MAVRDILQLGHPLLWTPTEIIDNVTAPETRETVMDLAETLAAFRAENGFGRGIAAPQIGVSRRLLYIDTGDGLFAGAMLNPRIVDADQRHFEVWDDCFSLPGLLVKVRRSCRVNVEYEDLDGACHTVTAKRQFAELVQHEIDHLDGVLSIDRAIDQRSICTQAEWERRNHSG